MIIPVGLIASLVQAAVADDEYSDDAARLQWESNMQAGKFENEIAHQQGRARELWDACTGPTGCLLVLVDNAWASTEIDHVRMDGVATTANASAAGGYRETADPVGAGPHGLVAVCPGRHAIRTALDDRSVDTDVTLFPGEAVFRRLDRESGTWVPYDLSTQEQMLERVRAGQLSLLNYWEHVGEPRMKAMVGKSAAEALYEAMTHLRATLEAIVRGNQSRAMQHVTQAGRALVGAPVISFQPITSFIGWHAFDLVGKDMPHEAWLLIQAGLAILPDDPTITAALGEIQLRSGSSSEGKATLRRALDRQGGLDPVLGARLRELLSADA
jgi:hypothetical protein